MEIHKFGGASVKDAQSVQNIKNILKNIGYTNTIVVISAMGKTTNALEKVVNHYLDGHLQLEESIEAVKNFHKNIADELFCNKKHVVFNKIEFWFSQLENFIKNNKSDNYSFVYDQIIVLGELLSTTIISEFLKENNIENQWIDAREIIQTDNNYQDAKVIWNKTQSLVQHRIKKSQLYITQGFIAGNSQGFSTTLAREGSDYSAAILAYCSDAEKVTIWKDVSGVFNADPRYFTHPILLEKIPYNEAIELAFYGASIIHPKTLQPLQQKKIPMFVRSFHNPNQRGSVISDIKEITPECACFILKPHQILLSLSSLDFSFIMEDHISFIFNQLHLHKLKVSTIQNTAISFSVCIEDKYKNFRKILPILSEKFQVSFKENVNLYTIRRASNKDILEITKEKKILLKQQLLETTQIITE